VHATENHKKFLKYSLKNKLMLIYLQYISSNNSTCFGCIYNTSTRFTSSWWAVETPGICRGVWRNTLKIKCASSWFFFKWIYRDTRSTKHKTQKYCWSWNVKQTKLFICVTTLLTQQDLDNIILLLNQMFCFTVLQAYFLLVVYSLYRELKGTARPNIVWRVRLNNTSCEGNYTTLVCLYS